MAHELTGLPNIGKTTAQGLIAVGIDSIDALYAAGSRQAFREMMRDDPGVCLNLLYGLEGAIQGVPSNLLDERNKALCRAFYKQLKESIPT